MIIYEAVFKKFQEKKVKYVIVGGIAANLLGLIRATADLDIVIDMNAGNIRKVDEALRSLAFKAKQPIDVRALDTQALMKLKKEKNLKALNYYKANELSEVDIIIDSSVSFEQAKRHARTIPVGGLKLPVISIDDLIRMKSATGRSVDKFDVEQMKKIRRMTR